MGRLKGWQWQCHLKGCRPRGKQKGGGRVAKTHSRKGVLDTSVASSEDSNTISRLKAAKSETIMVSLFVITCNLTTMNLSST